jgi:hypothetical protein
MEKRANVIEAAFWPLARRSISWLISDNGVFRSTRAASASRDLSVCFSVSAVGALVVDASVVVAVADASASAAQPVRPPPDFTSVPHSQRLHAAATAQMSLAHVFMSPAFPC